MTETETKTNPETETYTVRAPGHAAWTEHVSAAEAISENARARGLGLLTEIYRDSDLAIMVETDDETLGAL